MGRWKIAFDIVVFEGFYPLVMSSFERNKNIWKIKKDIILREEKEKKNQIEVNSR